MKQGYNEGAGEIDVSTELETRSIFKKFELIEAPHNAFWPPNGGEVAPRRMQLQVAAMIIHECETNQCLLAMRERFHITHNQPQPHEVPLEIPPPTRLPPPPPLVVPGPTHRG